MTDKNSESLIFWPKHVMIIAGFWNKPVSENRLVQNLFLIYSVIANANYMMCWLQLLAEFIRLVLGGYPADLIINALSVVVTATKVLIKLVIYLKNNVLDMFNDVIEKEREVWESSAEVKKMYSNQIRISKFCIVVVVSSCFSGIYIQELTGAVATVQMKRYNEANNATLEPHFMFLTLHPRDKLANLKLTFVTQLLWSWGGFTFNSMTHVVFLTLLIYSAARLQMLQVRLRTYIGPDFSDDPTEEEVNEKIMTLKSLIDEHKDIIRYIELLNERVKNIVLMDFVLSSLDIASAAADLMKKGFSGESGWQFFFLVLVVSQISFTGWTCNEIKVQSEAVADALYQSRWYLLNKEGKQLTLIMLARAQRPLMITIGPFGPMTTESVVLIFKAAYSYVNIMGN